MELLESISSETPKFPKELGLDVAQVHNKNVMSKDGSLQEEHRRYSSAKLSKLSSSTETSIELMPLMRRRKYWTVELPTSGSFNNIPHNTADPISPPMPAPAMNREAKNAPTFFLGESSLDEPQLFSAYAKNSRREYSDLLRRPENAEDCRALLYNKVSLSSYTETQSSKSDESIGNNKNYCPLTKSTKSSTNILDSSSETQPRHSPETGLHLNTSDQEKPESESDQHKFMAGSEDDKLQSKVLHKKTVHRKETATKTPSAGISSVCPEQSHDGEDLLDTHQKTLNEAQVHTKRAMPIQTVLHREEQKMRPKKMVMRVKSAFPLAIKRRGQRRPSEIPKITIEDHSVTQSDSVPDLKVHYMASFLKRKTSLFGLPTNLKSIRKKGDLNSLREAPDMTRACNPDMNLLAAEQIREREFKVAATKELKKLYSQFCVPFPSGWLKTPITISDIFVKPDLSFNRKPVALEKLFLVKPNRSCKNPLIVIKGQPGSGKTALCQYLVHCWLQDESPIIGLDSIELLLMVECKFVASNLMSSLRSFYLRDSITRLPRAETDDEYLLEVINKFQTLVIFDGFDEIQDSFRDALKKIRTKLPYAKVIVTTRLSGIREIQETLNLDLNYDYVELLLDLFDENKLVRLVLNISHMNSISDDLQFQLLDHIDDNFSALGVILMVPLHLVLYLILWIRAPKITETIRTTIDIFDGVLEFMCSQLSLDITRQTGQLQIDELQVISWLREVGQVSLLCIQKRQFYFTPPEYHSLASHSGIYGLNIQSALNCIMQEVCHLPGRDLKIFCHITVMEHMAASFMEHYIDTTPSGIFELLTPNENITSAQENCWRTCSSLTWARRATAKNSGSRNYQLDSAISHLVKISSKRDHNTYQMGKELATYFPINSNRNLVNLSNIISLLQKRDDPLKHGLKKGISNQKLPYNVHMWNVRHVVTLLEHGVLAPSVEVRFSVENSRRWAPIVNKLVELGCRPRVQVVIENEEQQYALVTALEEMDKPSVPRLVLYLSFVDTGINELVDSWPYPKTMCIACPEGKYAIESFVACVFIVKAMSTSKVKSVRFTGHESSYILGLLKKSLSNIDIQFHPYYQNSVQFDIIMHPT